MKDVEGTVTTTCIHEVSRKWLVLSRWRIDTFLRITGLDIGYGFPKTDNDAPYLLDVTMIHLNYIYRILWYCFADQRYCGKLFSNNYLGFRNLGKWRMRRITTYQSFPRLNVQLQTFNCWKSGYLIAGTSFQNQTVCCNTADCERMASDTTRYWPFYWKAGTISDSRIIV